MNGSRNRTATLGIALILGSSVICAAAQKIYWINGRHLIRRCNLDGSNVQTVVSSLQGGIDLTVDEINRKMYWTDAGTHRITRASLYGLNIQTLVLGQNHPWGIDLDVAGGKMYWASYLGGKIRRANLDGSEVEDLVSTGAGAVALDLKGGKVYWTSSVKIQRADLDGGNVEAVVTSDDFYPVSIAVDSEHEHIYWVANDLFWGELGVIRRANLDGSNIVTLVGPDPPYTSFPESIALAVERGEMYWADYRHGIRRANLDGTEVVDLFDAFSPRGIALDLHCCRPYGDIAPPDCGQGEWVVDIADLLCVFDAYGDWTLCPPADIAPCGGDGQVELADILAMLHAFGGLPLCATTCPYFSRVQSRDDYAARGLGAG